MTIEALTSLDPVAPSSEFMVAIIMDIADGWHINAHEPIQEYLVGTQFNLQYHDNFIISDINYPQAQKHEFDFAMGDPLLVYGGRESIFMTLRASPGIEPGGHLLTGKLSVQACDDNVCLAPSYIDVEIPLRATLADTEPSLINQEIFAAYASRAGAGHDPARSSGHPYEIAALFDAGGYFWAFLTIFLVGLALNLTPCIYPMLSVTVSVFGAQRSSSPSQVVKKAATYVLGIATMYSLLGVAAALTGKMFGFWLQSPLVLIIIGILLCFLALGMLGVYEIRVPSRVGQKLGNTSYTGYVGIYLSGLVVGVFAAPCIGPPVIALVAFVSTTGDPVFGFWVFFILSMGLGLPYLILGTFTGLLQKMPRAGRWMNWIKKIFGIALIGLGLFYLGLVLYPGFVMHVIVLTMLAGGVYLGFIEGRGVSGAVARPVKILFGSTVIIAGTIVFMSLHKESVQWQDHSPQYLEYARQNNLTSVLYFSADWCIPCLEMERTTFTDQRVIAAMEPKVRLKVDLTSFDSPQSEELRMRHEIIAVPSIIFLNGDGEEIQHARAEGFLDSEGLLRKMAKVWPQSHE